MARSADWEKWVAKTEKWLKTDPPTALWISTAGAPNSPSIKSIVAST
jgi:hypothetical protein